MNLAAELGFAPASLIVADIGAANLGTKELHLAISDSASIYCFDAEADARRQIAENNSGLIVLPYIVGDGDGHMLHILPGGMTSLLAPSKLYWRYFTLFGTPPFWPIDGIVKTEAVPTRRLDDIEEVPPIDFLKIDTQGSELMILRNGKAKLSGCSVVQIEMSFVALYENQPLFADVDNELRQQGFMPHGFATMKRLPVFPYAAQGSLGGINQLVDLDMIYVRNLVEPTSLTDDQLRKTALILHQCYGSYDVTLRCLVELVRRGLYRIDLANRYFEHSKSAKRKFQHHPFPASS